MVGRPRKQNVRRYANGKVARPTLDQEAPSPALVKRASTMSLLGLASPEYGTTAGIYFLRRIIDPHEYEAAKRFGDLYRQYSVCVGGPRRPKSVDVEGVIKQAPVDAESDAGQLEAERHIEVLRRYHEAHSALTAAGRGVEVEVVQFCDGIGQPPNGHEGLIRLRRGLGSLVIIWKIRGKK